MKNLISVISFCLLFLFILFKMNEVLVDKSSNRYYILSKELEKQNEIDVQIYGSCHAYTSFDALYFQETYKVSAYNMANPCEIIPATYLRMLERFQTDVPEVALVECWGVNAYETYIPTADIMGGYLRSNIEDISFSKEKIELINKYETLRILEENLAAVKYKGRLLNGELMPIDFHYSFNEACNTYNVDGGNWVYNEMKNRLSNNGYKRNSSNIILDYSSLQADIEAKDQLAVEADIMEYIEKIIALCKANDVTLIFYRAPYVSTENELRKVHYLENYFEQKELLFIDLEQEIVYDYSVDFYDYQHLSEYGAKKSTDYLGEIIINLAFFC